MSCFVRFEQEFEGDAQGRTPDGKGGEEVGQAIQAGQECALQASGEQDKTDDEEGRAPCAPYAQPPTQQPVLLNKFTIHSIPPYAAKSLFQPLYILIRCSQIGAEQKNQKKSFFLIVLKLGNYNDFRVFFQ